DPGRASTSTASAIDTDVGTGAATVQGKAEASKSTIARVALQPRLTCVQKRSRPAPNGETTPMPVIATRAPPITQILLSLSKYTQWLKARQHLHSPANSPSCPCGDPSCCR